MSVDADLATLREELTRFLVPRRGGKYPQRDYLDALARVEAELYRLRETQADTPTSDEIAESALWLDAVSEAFPDFDFSGCYDFDDLRKHMIGQASRLREQVKFCPYCAGGFVPNSPSYQGPCAGCQRAQAAETELATATTTAELAIRQLETAEARCARLQQALRPFVEEYDFRAADYLANDEAARVFSARTVDLLIEHQRAAREALAGPDTPAYVNPFLVPNPGIPEVIWGDTPADSRPDHQDDYPLPADSRRCQCPVGSYDRGNAVHADYCPLADSQPEEPT
jgi:hypothetical protein